MREYEQQVILHKTDGSATLLAINANASEASQTPCKNK